MPIYSGFNRVGEEMDQIIDDTSEKLCFKKTVIGRGSRVKRWLFLLTRRNNKIFQISSNNIGERENEWEREDMTVKATNQVRKDGRQCSTEIAVQLGAGTMDPQ